jgi:hypothetical protein
MELMIARASDIYIGASTIVVKNKSVHLNRARRLGKNLVVIAFVIMLASSFITQLIKWCLWNRFKE